MPVLSSIFQRRSVRRSRGSYAISRSVAVLLALAILPLVGGSAAGSESPRPVGERTLAQAMEDMVERKIETGVLDALRRGEHPAVMIALNAPPVSEVDALKSEVATAQDAVLALVRPGELEIRHRFEAVPALAATVNNEAVLERLAASPRVRHIDLEIGGTGGLAASIPVIQGEIRHARGNRGAGAVVAVLDSGLDTDHPDLADSLVAEACFGDNNGGIDGQGFCPNSSDRQTGAGAAEDDAGHGTHVSGIVASNGTVSGTGMAPDAGIVGVKVLDNCSFSGCFYAFSEIVAALDYIITNPGFGVQVINMSLGTGATFPGTCDAVNANTMSGAAAINTLRANGVIAFASAGNNGSSTDMTLPACLSNVVSVGATDNTDAVAGFSNSNNTTDIFAPGVGIQSLGIGGGTANASGTSMASPHAAGCAALLLQAGDANTPNDIETRLETTTVQVTDPKNSLSFPRIDCAPDTNLAPDLTVTSAAIAVDEGALATNSGTFTDPDGDPVTLSASVGTVVDAGGGNWSWSLQTIDGPVQSQLVSITGTDTLDAAGSVTFPLTVDNVAPIVDAGPDAVISSNSPFELTGSFGDPGLVDAPWSYEIDWGNGSTTPGSTADQSAPIVAGETFCGAGTYAVVLSVTDKDAGIGSDTAEVTVEHASVQIDVKPNGGSAPINLRSRGMIPVAVLTTATFDATTVDVASVRLGDGTGPGTPVAQRPNGTFYASVEDINGDGLADLMLHFRTQELVANGDADASSTELQLEGFLQDGCTNVLGSEAVNVVA